jgi:N-acetylglucosaminyldiphosphoundecaprenol N-acetyl-beta-D-mannosaminyltransferase
LGRARVFLLGSTEETLTGIVNRMTKEWPAIRVVGTYAPPFRPGFTDDDIEAMVGRINSAEPDVLWVGITAPKQEELLWRLRGRLNVRFAAAIGGAFDFYVGNIPRAGTAFRRIGLEWLPRLLREPRRLWRRSFVSAPIFLMHVIRQRIVPERMRH